MGEQLMHGTSRLRETDHAEEARRLLQRALQADPHSERHWLRLSEVVETDAERRFCLQQVLFVNRRNALARRRLQALGPGAAHPPHLQQALTARRAGDGATARCLLEQAVRADPRCERAWLHLARLTALDEERRFCLIQTLAINPRNAVARRQLESMGLDSWGPASIRSPLRRWEGPYPADQTPWSLVSGTSAAASSATRDRRALPDRGAALVALAYLAALTAAEALTALLEPRLGLILHGVLLVALIVHAALTWKSSWEQHLWEASAHRLLLTLAFGSLIRLLSLSLPLAGFPILYWYLIVSVPLFLTAAAVAQALNLKTSDVGLTLRRPFVQAAVTCSGVVLGYVEYQILTPQPLAPSLTLQDVWLPALILMVCTGFAEELIFRGIMQRAATETLGLWWGVLYVAAVFAVLHMGYQSLLDILFVFGVAVFFGWVKERTGSIWGVSLAHGVTNAFLFLVMPFLLPIGGV